MVQKSGNRERVRVQKFFNKPSLTVQSEKDTCDINKIMVKYTKTGLVNHLNRYQGQYGDFTNIQDYQTSLHQVMKAQDMFSALPSSVRARFLNDPAEFLNFVSNPDNKDEMINLGLIESDEQKLLKEKRKKPAQPAQPAAEGSTDA